jgi:hypothetical protein
LESINAGLLASPSARQKMRAPCDCVNGIALLLYFFFTS